MQATTDYLYSASVVVQTFQLQIPSMCGFRRGKTTFTDNFSARHYLYSPFSLVRGYAQKTTLIFLGCLANVLQIAKSVHLTQVCEAIVLFIPVYVVNVLRWKTTCHVQPRQTVRQSFLIVNSDCPVACACRASGASTNKIRAVCVASPHKLSSVGVVLKNRSKMVSGNHEFHLTIEAVK